MPNIKASIQRAADGIYENLKKRLRYSLECGHFVLDEVDFPSNGEISAIIKKSIKPIIDRLKELETFDKALDEFATSTLDRMEEQLREEEGCHTA